MALTPPLAFSPAPSPKTSKSAYRKTTSLCIEKRVRNSLGTIEVDTLPLRTCVARALLSNSSCEKKSREAGQGEAEGWDASVLCKELEREARVVAAHKEPEEWVKIL